MCGRFAQDRTKIPPALLALLTEQYVVKEPDYLRVTETATAVKPDEPIGRTLFDSLGDEPEPVAPKREWSPVSYNVRPMQRVLVARTIEADPDKNTPERTEMADLYWRLIPRWLKNIKEFKGSTINARSEELEEKSTWKGLVKKQRCLVPMIGFYEPQRFGNEKDPFSIPWFIYQKTGEPFCVGGLWEHMYDVPTD